jgi:hypothetical protein
MELAKAIRSAGVVRVVGLGTVALLLGSMAMFGVPRAVHAQDDTAVSGDDSAATDNTDSDTMTDDGDVDASKPPPSVAGSWSGPAIDKKLGGGTLTLTLTQATKAVAATVWEAAFPDDSDAGGTGSGKLNGKALKLILIDPTIPKGKCTMTISSKVLLDDGVADEIKGTYTLKKCFVKNSSGTIDLTPAATPTPTP